MLKRERKGMFWCEEREGSKISQAEREVGVFVLGNDW